ncbi:hypothetical protein GPN2_21030 [Streptomyces murinus]
MRQDALHEDLVGGGVRREQFHDLGGEGVQRQRVRVHLLLARRGDRRGDEFHDADSGAGELCAQRLGVGVHRGLRGGVAGHGREGQERDAGGDGDEGAGAPPDQMRGEGVDHPDGAEQVGLDRRPRRLEVRRVAQVLHEHDARHGHHRVQPGVAVEHGVTGGGDGGTVGDIDLERAEALLGQFRERPGATAADGHGAARRGEPPGQLPPDARGAADDEDGAVGEIHEIFLSAEIFSAESYAKTVLPQSWRRPPPLAGPPFSLVLPGPPLGRALRITVAV